LWRAGGHGIAPLELLLVPNADHVTIIRSDQLFEVVEAFLAALNPRQASLTVFLK
jgi:hypothetical protein